MVAMPHWPKPLGFRPQHYSLERLLEILDLVGNPHLKIENIIHVGGTNGKGSVIAFLKAILQRAGFSVNVYTSPHLVHFNERIELSGEQITDRYLFDITDRCRHFAQEKRIPVTFFEGTTVAAFLAFSEKKADFNIIEVGLGGRYDATNVFDKKMLNIFSSISYDHMEVLGSEIGSIAFDKSGIIRDDAPTVIAEQVHKEALLVLSAVADNSGSDLFRASIEWKVEDSDGKLRFTDSTRSQEFQKPSLIGKHQFDNAGAAIAATSILCNKYGYKISDDHISDGISNTYWPARLERISHGKFYNIVPDGWKIYLDGAHNSGAAAVISDWLSERDEGCKNYVVLGVTKDKDTEAFYEAIKPNIDYLIGVCVESEPRSENAEVVTSNAKKYGINAESADSVKEAISKLVLIAKNNKVTGARILICGSLFLAGDVLKQNGIYNELLPLNC